MACECGCTTAVPDADAAQEVGSGCGCGTGQVEEGMDVGALARLVRELDQRVKQLELETSRS